LAATEAFFFGVVAGAMGRFSFLRLPTRVAMSGGRVVQLALHKIKVFNDLQSASIKNA